MQVNLDVFKPQLSVLLLKRCLVLPLMTVIHNFLIGYLKKQCFIFNSVSNLRKLQLESRRQNLFCYDPDTKQQPNLEMPVLSTSNNSKLSQGKCPQHVGDLFGYNNIALQRSIPSLLAHFAPEGANLLKTHGGGTGSDLHTMMKCVHKCHNQNSNLLPLKQGCRPPPSLLAVIHPSKLLDVSKN